MEVKLIIYIILCCHNYNTWVTCAMLAYKKHRVNMLTALLLQNFNDKLFSFFQKFKLLIN